MQMLAISNSGEFTDTSILAHLLEEVSWLARYPDAFGHPPERLIASGSAGGGAKL